MTSAAAVRLLSALSGQGASPVLTWYGRDGERTELSGRVLANWVTKAANLLIEEADAEPGTRVVVDLPVHWRAVVWALGTWVAGAEVVLADVAGGRQVGLDGDERATGAGQVAGTAGERPEVVVTARPGEAPGQDDAELVLAVALPALAMRWDGPALPGGVVDAAAELMTYADELTYAQEPDDDDAALGTVGHGELGQWAAAAAGQLGAAAGARLVLSPRSVTELLAQTLGLWQAQASVVLVEPGLPERRVREIAAEERAELRG